MFDRTTKFSERQDFFQVSELEEGFPTTPIMPLMETISDNEQGVLYWISSGIGAHKKSSVSKKNVTINVARIALIYRD